MSRLRAVIAKRMVESLQVSAQLTTVVEVDVTRIAKLRDQAKADFQARHGVKLSFLPFFALATVEALRVHPTRQRVHRHGGRHGHLPRRRAPRHRGRHRARPGRAGHPRRRRPQPGRSGQAHRRPGRPHPHQQDQPGRALRRHVHADQHRQPGRAVRHPDHQPAAGRHPRHRLGGQAGGRGRATPTSARSSRRGRWSTWPCRTTTGWSTARTPPASSPRIKERLEAGAFENDLGL